MKFSNNLRKEYLPLFFASIFVGIVVGLIVGLFNKLLKLISGYSVEIYSFVQDNLIFIPLLFIGLILLAFLMHIIQRKNPQVRGGGIPQTIALSKGEIKYKWYQVLWSNIVCSSISFFGGLPVGAEGPSMFAGSSTADGLHKNLKLRPYTRKYLITAGASSGLSATFNAPLAGIVFAIEKVHRKFSPLLLFVVCTAVLSSTITINLVSMLWGGQSLFFDFPFLKDISFNYYWILAVLGVIIGVCAYLFQILLIKSQKLLDGKTKQFPYWLRLICAFVLTGVAGILFIDTITGGHDLIEKIASLDFAVTSLLIILAIKLILITFCYNSGTTGGLFIPSLCLGAIVGGICGHIMIELGLPSNFYSTIVCFSMLAFLAGITHAPISSLVLLLEITGFNGTLLSAGLVIILSFITALILRRKSLYEEQVDRLVASAGFDENCKSTFTTIKLNEDSVLIGKRVADIFLPQALDMSSIKRNEELIVSDSETRFLPNDEVTFIYQINNKQEVDEFLDDIT